MHFLKQFWRFAHFSFCIWFYVFIPGSHCFAIDKLNGTAICTVHFRSIWTAPLRFSIRRSWAGSKVTAAKLDPKKSNLKNKFQSSTFRTGFSFFLHVFTRFHIFSKCIFKTHFFTVCPSAFSKHIFHFFILFYFFFLSVKNAGEMRFENALGKNVKKCGLKMRKTCEKMWNMWTKGSWKGLVF